MKKAQETPKGPEDPAAPQGKAHQAADTKGKMGRANHAPAPQVGPMAPSMDNKGAQLPSTGEAASNPFFTAAALTVMASAGILARKRKEEN